MKHSQTSPISPNPYHQFNNFLYQRHIHPYYLILQQHPKLSHYIPHKTNLKHQSPQPFYFLHRQINSNPHHH
ncbi:monothiol bacilliredoxin BrxC family protein, partial [Staphylococcus epidermidis]|uniref:monothiol bacilliredoxin BrxC family protein n=1 Tax=Staphylococcus epidermidis TaxID=1282 RepID=UPI0021B1E0BA